MKRVDPKLIIPDPTHAHHLHFRPLLESMLDFTVHACMIHMADNSRYITKHDHIYLKPYSLLVY